MIARILLNGTIVAAALALAACGQTPAPVVGTMAAQPVENDNQGPFALGAAADYRLLPTDTVSITVFREPDLSIAQVPVGADGMIALPLVGTIKAQGLTSAELASTVASALSHGYLNRPEVAVNVIALNSHRVSVEGAVKRAGVFAFSPGARLSSAISQAEGMERVAKLDQVVVFRPTAEGMTVAKFDYRAMQQGTMIDPVLQPGDRVVVGTSGSSQFWQDLIKTLPSFAFFTQLSGI